MNNTWDSWGCLKRLRANKALLSKIRADMDPASGVSISFRRGVARDNEEVPDDSMRRPWVTCELSDLGHISTAIDAAQAAMAEEERRWIKRCKEDLLEICKVLGIEPPKLT